MDSINHTSTRRLRRLADETERTLQDLREELRRREERAQHCEIDKIDEHMANAELNLSAIREFFVLVLNEWRKGSRHNDE